MPAWHCHWRVIEIVSSVTWLWIYAFWRKNLISQRILFNDATELDIFEDIGAKEVIIFYYNLYLRAVYLSELTPDLWMFLSWARSLQRGSFWRFPNCRCRVHPPHSLSPGGSRCWVRPDHTLPTGGRYCSPWLYVMKATEPCSWHHIHQPWRHRPRQTVRNIYECGDDHSYMCFKCHSYVVCVLQCHNMIGKVYNNVTVWLSRSRQSQCDLLR